VRASTAVGMSLTRITQLTKSAGTNDRSNAEANHHVADSDPNEDGEREISLADRGLLQYHLPPLKEDRCCILVDRVSRRIIVYPADFLTNPRFQIDESSTEIIFEDCSEEEALRYKTMHHEGKGYHQLMCAKPAADEARERGQAPYAQMSQDEYDALFHRMSKQEFLNKVNLESAVDDYMATRG
jgi:hypothetical protein